MISTDALGGLTSFRIVFDVIITSTASKRNGRLIKMPARSGSKIGLAMSASTTYLGSPEKQLHKANISDISATRGHRRHCNATLHLEVTCPLFLKRCIQVSHDSQLSRSGISMAFTLALNISKLLIPSQQ